MNIEHQAITGNHGPDLGAPWFIISACVEAEGPHDCAYNIQNAQACDSVLQALLRCRQVVSILPLSGRYKGVDQGASWLVFGPERVARGLCEMFRQESFCCNRGLIYPRQGKIVPQIGIKFGAAALAEDFYSALPSGEVFSLIYDWEHPIDLNINL